MDDRRWRVGELAEQAGVTVRALHHFDAIGLLTPAGRSAAGHRWYTADEVRRLYRILALRELGVPLAEIGAALDGASLEDLVSQQLDRVDGRLRGLRLLRRRLLALQESPSPSIGQLLSAVEATMDTNPFTPEQLAQMKARHAEPGFAGTFARWQEDATAIAGKLGEHLRRGTDPADPAVQDLARRWQAIMLEMAGGERDGLSRLYAKIDNKGPEQATRGILESATWEYLLRAFAVGFSG